jgi:hypothetical protein
MNGATSRTGIRAKAAIQLRAQNGRHLTARSTHSLEPQQTVAKGRCSLHLPAKARGRYLVIDAKRSRDSAAFAPFDLPLQSPEKECPEGI